jgi:hypothetical protein
MGKICTAADSIIPIGKRQSGDGEQPRKNDLFDSNVAGTLLDRPNREAVKQHSPGQAQRRPGLAVGEEF